MPSLPSRLRSRLRRNRLSKEALQRGRRGYDAAKARLCPIPVIRRRHRERRKRVVSRRSLKRVAPT